MIKRIILAAMLAASLGTAAIPSGAAVVVRVAPPPPREEAVPAPRHGYTWSGGYWDWRGGKHHWVKGNWVKERRGYRYNQPTWAERDGRWHMDRGGWKRGDRDGDGVPNSQDRAPDNPNRR